MIRPAPTRAGRPRRRPPERPRLLDLGRAVTWHRRKLAALAAVAAVLTAVTAVNPPDPPSVRVVRAVAEIAPGSTVSARQVRTERLPVAALPHGYLDQVSAVVGRTVIAAIPVGQVLTTHSTLAASAVRAGRVIAPLRLDDTDLTSWLRAGDRVDILSAADQKPATVVVQRARIVSIPAEPASGGMAVGGSSPTGAVLLVDVDIGGATKLAQAAVASRLSVVLRS